MKTQRGNQQAPSDEAQRQIPFSHRPSLAAPVDGQARELAEGLLHQAAKLPPPGGDVGKCLSPEVLADLSQGKFEPGMWSHVTRCDRCRRIVREKRTEQKSRAARAGLPRLWAHVREAVRTYFGPGARPLLPVSLVAAALVMLVLVRLSATNPYADMDAFLSAEGMLLSNGQLAANAVEAEDEPALDALLAQARTVLQPVYPKGTVSFRLIASREAETGRPPEVFVVLSPETGEQRTLLNARATQQAKVLTVLATDGQSWPAGIPLRVSIALGTRPDLTFEARNEAITASLPDALALRTTASTPAPLSPSHVETGGLHRAHEASADALSSLPGDGGAIDKGKTLPCSSCETGKQVPPALMAEGEKASRRQSHTGSEAQTWQAVSAGKAAPSIDSSGASRTGIDADIHPGPLPIRCSTLRTEGWWICDLPMRLVAR